MHPATFPLAAGALWAVRPVLLLVCVAAAASAAAHTPPWRTLRGGHPRLFLNQDTLPAVRARALGAEKAHYERMKRGVDRAAPEPAVQDLGFHASAAAFIRLATGDPAYLARAKAFLERSLDFYERCVRQKKAVNWYSHSRINALAAYDWLFNDLTPEERRAFGKRLLDHVAAVQKGGVFRRNRSSHTTGFYGTTALLWYAGLALHGAGVDDPRATQFLQAGYGHYMALLAHRRSMAGDDGGSASACPGYAMGHYPLAETNFFHTMASAFGVDLAAQWRYPAHFVGWVMWNWIDHPDGPLGFGTGDSSHATNGLPLYLMFSHLAQLRHFYARLEPDCAALARWMQDRLPEKLRRHPVAQPYPWYPFLMTRIAHSPPPKPPAALLPPARHFERMGQVFLRSGSGLDDTYALFTAGMASRQHKHFDENSFAIYHKGHLALDTGSRPEPGIHLSHYYCRSVAHNCVLIHMPGETLPRYWGRLAPGEESLPVPNDGGMCRQTGAKVVAFETHPEFTYLASDATACYHPKKCRLALRQFLFIPPAHFVVFDRVVSTQPAFKKTWLLHTPAEPAVAGDAFSAVGRQGKLCCRTLLPERPVLTKVGGPCKQFWSGGRNWPFPSSGRWAGKESNPLFGQWRVEVSPPKPSAEDWFLHLIQVGGRAELRAMCESSLVRLAEAVGLEFQAGARTITLFLEIQGPPGGSIRIAGAGALRRDLTRTVHRQADLAGLRPK